MFEEPTKLVLGLITGVAFGFLLQKGQVAKFQVILGQLLLRDWTVLKIMAAAIAVGAIGVNFLVAGEIASLHIKTASLARVIGGGVLFGIGLAIYGLCPGTGVAASGEGRHDAMVGVIGMLFGAGFYVILFQSLQPLFQSLADYGKVTLPQITGTSTALWVVGLALLTGAVFGVVGKRGSRFHPR